MGGISDVDTDYQAMVTERRYGHEEEMRDGGIEGHGYGLRVCGCVAEPCGPQSRFRRHVLFALFLFLNLRANLNVFQSTTPTAQANFLARCRSVLQYWPTSPLSAPSTVLEPAVGSQTSQELPQVSEKSSKS